MQCLCRIERKIRNNPPHLAPLYGVHRAFFRWFLVSIPAPPLTTNALLCIFVWCVSYQIQDTFDFVVLHGQTLAFVTLLCRAVLLVLARTMIFLQIVEKRFCLSIQPLLERDHLTQGYVEGVDRLGLFAHSFLDIDTFAGIYRRSNLLAIRYRRPEATLNPQTGRSIERKFDA